jgi:O-antigen ligase
MKQALVMAPFAGFVFILPFPGTVAFRLLCLALAFAIALLWWKRFTPPPVPAKAALAFWALITGVSIAYSFDPAYSAGEWKNEVGYALMAFVAFLVFVRGRQELAVLLAALAVATTVICVWGTAGTIRAGVWDDASGHGGVGALSAYFAAVAPVLAVAALAVRSRPVRIALLLALVLLLIGALAGRQRMLWPIFLVQLLAGVVLARSAGLVSISRRALWTGMAAAALVTATAFAALQAARLQSGQVRPLTQDVRLAAWPAIVDRIMQQPMTGTGLGRQGMSRVYPELVREKDYFWHSHNSFLNAGISMGVPGVVALLWLFGAFTAVYLRLLRDGDATARWLGIAGLLMLTGIAARNMTNDFFVRDGALLFWSLNGALLGAGLRLRRAV